MRRLSVITIRARTNPTLTGEALREVRRDAGKKGAEHGVKGGRGKKAEKPLPDDIRKGFSDEPAYGTSKAYVLRRLAAEHPDTLAAYESGAFASAAAAGRAAGILPT